MPEWLLKNESYEPLPGRDKFINKNIITILGFIGRVKVGVKNKESKLKLNALVKLISMLVFIILISLSKNFTFVLICGVIDLFIINIFSVNEIKSILKIGIAAAVMTFVLFLPAIFLGYGNNAFFVSLKVLLTVVAANMFAFSTQWNDIIRAFKVFHVPDMFIFVMDITIKYIIVLSEFALDMVYALKLRSIGKTKNKSSSLTGIIGTLFLKSRDMSDELYGAMECRGFTGEYITYRKFRFTIEDCICIILNIAFVVMYFYFDRL